MSVAASALEFSASVTGDGVVREDILIGRYDDAPHDTAFEDRLRSRYYARHIGSRALDQPDYYHQRIADTYDVTTEDGTRLLVERAAAAQGPHTQELVVFPGLTEHIGLGLAKRFRDQLSAQFPWADVITVGSNGVGTPGYRDTTDRARRNRQRLDLLATVAGDKELTTFGDSMGYQVVNDLAALNMYEGRPLNVVGQVGYATAVLPGCQTRNAMMVRFVPRLAYDISRMVISHPTDITRNVPAFAQWAVQAVKDAPSGANQVVNHLLQGTEIEQLVRVAEAGVPTLVINGSKDPVCGQKIHEDLAEAFPSYHFKHVAGRGHDLPFEFDRPAAVIGREMRRWGLLPQPFYL